MAKKRTHNIHCVRPNTGNPYYHNSTYTQKYPLNVGDVINFTFEGFPDNTPITVIVKGRKSDVSWGTNPCVGCPLSYIDTSLSSTSCRAVRSLKRQWSTRKICHKGSSWTKSFSFINPAELLEEL